MEQWLWSALSFLAGTLLGHWLALGREHRRALNSAGQPLRAWIVRQLNRPTVDLWSLPSDGDIDAFTSRLPRRKARLFHVQWKRMLKAYAAAHSRGEEGELIFHGTTKGVEALRAL